MDKLVDKMLKEDDIFKPYSKEEYEKKFPPLSNQLKKKILELAIDYLDNGPEAVYDVAGPVQKHVNKSIGVEKLSDTQQDEISDYFDDEVTDAIADGLHFAMKRITKTIAGLK